MKSVPAIFSALIEQTLQRGGIPSVREISDAANICNNIVACWGEVRYAESTGIPSALAKAIKNMDDAVSQYEGN